MLVETDAGATASTGLSKMAKARTAKRTAIGKKPFTPVHGQTINGGAADGSAFLWNTNPQDNKGGLCPRGFCLWE